MRTNLFLEVYLSGLRCCVSAPAPYQGACTWRSICVRDACMPWSLASTCGAHGPNQADYVWYVVPHPSTYHSLHQLVANVFACIMSAFSVFACYVLGPQCRKRAFLCLDALVGMKCYLIACFREKSWIWSSCGMLCYAPWVVGHIIMTGRAKWWAWCLYVWEYVYVYIYIYCLRYFYLWSTHAWNHVWKYLQHKASGCLRATMYMCCTCVCAQCVFLDKNLEM